MISQDKLDRITNALITGMALDDAYIYAGLTEQEIIAVTEDEELQFTFRKYTKELEYSLLKDLHEVANRQIRLGKEGAITWMLEKMFPRYTNKTQEQGAIININAESIDAQYDPSTVKINKPE